MGNKTRSRFLRTRSNHKGTYRTINRLVHINNQYNITLQQVLDQLRNLKVRNNQLEELVRSLETDVETHKRDNTKLSDDKQVLQSEKERFEVETEDLSARMAVSYIMLNLNCLQI